jgi:hypothetical protein
VWGYTVDVKVAKVSTTNVGTVEAPVASVNMELSFNAHTVLQSHTATTVYQFRGDTDAIRSTEM